MIVSAFLPACPDDRSGGEEAEEGGAHEEGPGRPHGRGSSRRSLIGPNFGLAFNWLNFNVLRYEERRHGLLTWLVLLTVKTHRDTRLAVKFVDCVRDTRGGAAVWFIESAIRVVVERLLTLLDPWTASMFYIRDVPGEAMRVLTWLVCSCPSTASSRRFVADLKFVSAV